MDTYFQLKALASCSAMVRLACNKLLRFITRCCGDVHDDGDCAATAVTLAAYQASCQFWQQQQQQQRQRQLQSLCVL